MANAVSCVCDAIDTSDAGACFSPHRRFRYALWRRFPAPLTPRANAGKMLLVVMLNPSTADELTLDPTLRRVRAFAERDGYDGFVIANAFALRATDPRELIYNVGGYGQGLTLDDAIANAVGTDNDRHLEMLVARYGPAVVGWGANLGHRALAWREPMLWATLGDDVRAWGITADGHPGHPLYLPATSPLIPYPWRSPFDVQA